MTTAESLTWFVAGWCAATLVLTAYLIWLRRGGEASTAKKLRDAERALATAKQDYAQCNADRIRAIADCEQEMQYRNRDRRALGHALDTLSEVKELCLSTEAEIPPQVILRLIEGRPHG